MKWGGGNVNYYKSVYHSILTWGNKGQLGNFQNKSVRFLSIDCPVIAQTERGEEGLFWEVQERGSHFMRLLPRVLLS